MRILLAAMAIAIATPALANPYEDVARETQAALDKMHQGQEEINAGWPAYYRARAKERATDRRNEQAANDARCAKIGGASVGMNAAAIRKSCWGRPLRVNTTLTARGTHEQWVYAGGYLYLDDGVVTSIQTSR